MRHSKSSNHLKGCSTRPESRNRMRKRPVWPRARRKEEERFLSAQADRFAGTKREEKVGLLRSK